MTTFRSTFGRVWPTLVRSVPGWVTAALAYALIVYGVWLIYIPAGYITGGVLLIALERTAEHVWQASRQ